MEYINCLEGIGREPEGVNHLLLFHPLPTPSIPLLQHQNPPSLKLTRGL